jgi:hypothetical protein
MHWRDQRERERRETGVQQAHVREIEKCCDLGVDQKINEGTKSQAATQKGERQKPMLRD